MMSKINPQYHIEEVQAQELEQKAFFFDSSPDLCCILNPKGRIIRVNKSWESLLGWPQESLTGMELVQFAHPEDTEYVELMLVSAIKGQVQNAESRLISRNGEVYWFSWKSVLQEETGFVYASARDISLRKKTIQRLEEQSRRFFLATKATDTGIWDWLIHQNTVYYSAGWKAQLGYEKDELADSFETWQMLLHPDDYEKANNELGEYLKNPTELFESEFRLRHKDGSYRLISNRAASLLGEDMKPYRMLGTQRDITEQRKFENELRDARIKAETANIHKNNFLANMGHEIRTPMNSIIGFSELLKEPDVDLHDRDRYISIINENCNILLDLVDDIVDISKIEASEMDLKFSYLSIKELLQELNEYYNTQKYRLGKSQLEIRVITPDLKHNDLIETDHLRLRQIMNNLLNNAVKFTHQGSIEFGYNLPNEKEIQFFVRDTGIGIPADKMNIVFDRFHQSDEGLTRKYGGLGLGLSICQGLVELLHGKIWVDSEENKGSEFYFTIPYQPFLGSD